MRYRSRHGSRSRSRSPKNSSNMPRSPPGVSGNLRDKSDKDNIHRTSHNFGDRITDPGLKDGDKPSLQSVVVKAGTSLEKIESNNIF